MCRQRDGVGVIVIVVRGAVHVAGLPLGSRPLCRLADIDFAADAAGQGVVGEAELLVSALLVALLRVHDLAAVVVGVREIGVLGAVAVGVVEELFRGLLVGEVRRDLDDLVELVVGVARPERCTRSRKVGNRRSSPDLSTTAPNHRPGRRDSGCRRSLSRSRVARCNGADSGRSARA